MIKNVTRIQALKANMSATNGNGKLE